MVPILQEDAFADGLEGMKTSRPWGCQQWALPLIVAGTDSSDASWDWENSCSDSGAVHDCCQRWYQVESSVWMDWSVRPEKAETKGEGFVV